MKLKRRINGLTCDDEYKPFSRRRAGVLGATILVPGLIWDALDAQIIQGKSAYNVGPAGPSYNDFGIGAQAVIVDHWFGTYASGWQEDDSDNIDKFKDLDEKLNSSSATSDSYFRYIANNVVVAERIEPGSVMVLGEEGFLVERGKAYDNRVAGVISGAGDYKPGIVLDKKQGLAGRLPVALVGKVYCKVDAESAPVAVGDLLTTSATPGHAMKAEDPVRAFGAVIGKALRPLEAGRGLIPILVALQ